MFKKKKQQEAERLKAEQEAKAAKAAAKPRVVFRVMNNCSPVPVAAPADMIQLTPVVQPIPVVPYSSQMQPLAQFDDSDEYGEEYGDEE